jgi:hypothetical protein
MGRGNLLGALVSVLLFGGGCGHSAQAGDAAVGPDSDLGDLDGGATAQDLAPAADLMHTDFSDGRWAFDLGSAPTTLNACGEVTAPGSYTLGQDLTSTSLTVPCLSVHDTTDVLFDCGHHQITAPLAVRFTSVTRFVVRNCVLKNAAQYGFVLAIAKGQDGVVSGNTIDPVADVQATTGLLFDGNTVTGLYQQNGSSGNRISNNQISGTAGKDSPGLVISNYGSGNTVLSNTLDGKWSGTLPPLDHLDGTDDGVVLSDEDNDLVLNNTISNVYDCGIETLGNLTALKLINNSITKAGITGIGGWYWNSLSGSLIAENTIDQSGYLLLFTRIYGLRAAGYDPAKKRPAEQAVLFQDNVFDHNRFTNPSSYVYFKDGAAAHLPVYQLMGFSGMLSTAPGETVPTDAQFQLTNNVFRNNQVGTARKAPNFGSPVVPGLVIDGAGNQCGTSDVMGYPLLCN